jgi:O-succinylbenzoate synthase
MMARLTQEQWRTLIEEHAASGQTAVAFCAERGLDNKYFSSRKQQLSSTHKTSRFVSVVTKPTEVHSVQLVVGTVELRIPAGVSAQWVASLIRALT